MKRCLYACSVENAPGSEEDLPGAPSSVLRPRLGYCPDNSVPEWGELGLTAAKKAAFEWQEQRNRAQWHEMVWLTRDSGRSEWVREIHGLFGVIGELVLVATEAEVEKYLLANPAPLGDDGTGRALRAGFARSLRFFAEGQANYLTIAGHGAANLVLRTMVLHPSFDVTPWAQRLDVDPAVFRPASTARRAWTSLTPEHCRVFVNMAASLDSPILGDLAAQLNMLSQDERWTSLRELRNEQYHRWRGESPGVLAVTFGGESMLQTLMRGKAVGISGEILPEYKEGQTILDEIRLKSRAGLDAIVEWMPTFIDVWGAAFGALTSSS